MKTRLPSLFLGFILTATIMWAQGETGQITGTILDATGAIVPNATVTWQNIGTEAVRSTATNASGVYAITNLLPGTYGITVTAGGFSTFKENVEVTVGSKVGLDVHLEVGSSATTVQVAESAIRVNTETQTLGGVIDSQQVTELPSQTRNP